MTDHSPKDMLARLVAFDTTSRNSNMPLIDFVTEYLRDQGVDYELIPNEDGTKANLYATIGEAKPGGIVLSGHTDVVPVDGQDWSSDPFKMEERDGKLYGRGTCDMKGFVATALALVPHFTALKPKIPIHFAFSYDEEIGCVGVRPMIEHLRDHLPRPALVIVGEPTSMTVVNANKGIRTLMTEVTGTEAHSSRVDTEVNAIQVAAELIAHLGTLAAEMRERPDPSGRFEPPHTTLSVGRISGGTAVNIVPRSCRFLWEYRALPDQDPDEILNRFNAFVEDKVLPRVKIRAEEARIETVETAHSPGLRAEPGSPAETLVLRLAEQNSTHAVAYGAEAGLFQEIDIPTLICGPGDIAQAHQPDEFLALTQLSACERFLRRLADYAANG